MRSVTPVVEKSEVMTETISSFVFVAIWAAMPSRSWLQSALSESKSSGTFTFSSFCPSWETIIGRSSSAWAFT